MSHWIKRRKSLEQDVGMIPGTSKELTWDWQTKLSEEFTTLFINEEELVNIPVVHREETIKEA